MSDRPNIALPDELAQVRQDLKRLEQREAELRVLLIADPTARTGADWVADVVETTRQQTDLKELRAMHRDLVDEYTFDHTFKRVVLKMISEDGEILSPPRRKIAQ